MTSRHVRRPVLLGVRKLACSISLSLALAGCYNHYAAHTGVRVAPSGLPRAEAGSYVLTQAGEPVGREFIEMKSTSSTAWALTGRIEWTVPVVATTRYALTVVNRQPVTARASVHVLGSARTMSATVAAGYVQVEVLGVGPQVNRKVPYAAGTALDLVSPVMRLWVLGLLSPRLLPGASISVRTLRFDVPSLAPVVELQTFEVKKVQGDLRQVLVRRPEPHPPEALWVNAQGFVVRSRTWPRGLTAPFIERRWVQPQQPVE